MTLWLLRPVGYVEDDICSGGVLSNCRNPWHPEYDKTFGLVVRAETEAVAREIALKHAGDETDRIPRVWSDPQYATCDELTPNGIEGLVIRDFRSA